MVFYECMMTAKNTARELGLLSSWCCSVLHRIVPCPGIVKSVAAFRYNTG